MGDLLITALDVLVVVAVLVVLVVVAVALRHRLLVRAGGTVDVSLRREGARGTGWVSGLGRYADDELRWFRTFSFAPRPQRVLARRHLQVLDRRRPNGPERFVLPAGAVVLECSYGRPDGGSDGGSGPVERVELAMTEPASNGFLAWLEAAPPGRYRYR